MPADQARSDIEAAAFLETRPLRFVDLEAECFSTGRRCGRRRRMAAGG
jgi:hypothetical protein